MYIGFFININWYLFRNETLCSVSLFNWSNLMNHSSIVWVIHGCFCNL